MDDLISRKAAIDAIMDADVCVTWNGVISDDDAVDIAIKSTKGSVISSIVNLPSAQPETHEERTETRACDCIDRQAAIEALDKRFDSIPMEQTTEILLLRKDLRELPPAQPEHTNSWYINSWCIDCKEYDTENKCCPRYSRVIKQTLDDAYRHGETEAEARFYAEIVRCKDCKHSRFFDPCFYCYEFGEEINVPENGFCFMAERRTDGQ